jgi:hypothetical protein
MLYVGESGVLRRLVLILSVLLGGGEEGSLFVSDDLGGLEGLDDGEKLLHGDLTLLGVFGKGEGYLIDGAEEGQEVGPHDLLLLRGQELL